jgi:hypothetical protein
MVGRTGHSEEDREDNKKTPRNKKKANPFEVVEAMVVRGTRERRTR